jgi:hypothetical protein
VRAKIVEEAIQLVKLSLKIYAALKDVEIFRKTQVKIMLLILKLYYLCVWYAFYVQHCFRVHMTLFYGFLNNIFAYHVHYC